MHMLKDRQITLGKLYGEMDEGAPLRGRLPAGRQAYWG